MIFNMDEKWIFKILLYFSIPWILIYGIDYFLDIFDDAPILTFIAASSIGCKLFKKGYKLGKESEAK